MFRRFSTRMYLHYLQNWNPACGFAGLALYWGKIRQSPADYPVGGEGRCFHFVHGCDPVSCPRLPHLLTSSRLDDSTSQFVLLDYSGTCTPAHKHHLCLHWLLQTQLFKKTGILVFDLCLMMPYYYLTGGVQPTWQLHPSHPPSDAAIVHQWLAEG